MIRFLHPWFFLTLLLIIPLLYWQHLSGGRITFSNLKLFGPLKNYRPFHPRQILLLLRILALVLLIIALARPQSGKKFSEVQSDGIDIMLALDTSGSMQALDFVLDGERVDRLTIVKKVATQFIQKRGTDRMGLVVFGEEAFTQCPLTLDHGVLVDLLNKMEIGMAGDATAIGSAIGTAAKRLKDLPAKSKVIVLVTDGSNNSGILTPEKAAEMAQSLGIKIYTIGVGTRGQAPFPQDTIFGKRLVYLPVEIDEQMLTSIAKTTNARYFRATETAELEKIYAEIDRLEKRQVKVKEYSEYNELFIYFVVAGLGLLLLEIVLGQTKLKKLP